MNCANQFTKHPLRCGLSVEILYSLNWSSESYWREYHSIMFSPPANAVPPSASTRSSRRRQRPLSSESSASQPKAKRQRSALSEHTFIAPDAPPEMQEIKAAKAGGTTSRRENTRNALIPRRELAVRGKKAKLAERGSKNDGSVVLVCYSSYRCLLSPNFPLTYPCRLGMILTMSADFHHGPIAFRRTPQV